MSTLVDANALDAKPPTVDPVVDSDRPWPGLSPFKEEQHNYYFGRDDEIDELFRCVKRETVTLLFAKPGLGKSSLLQAGLFPRLRAEGFLPVYVRLNYSEVAEPLILQLKSAVQEAIRKGDFAEVSLPTDDESLWEYLHRRGGNIIDHSGNVVCPVFVLDQFEELFTLGARSDATRAVRDQFLDCFAQLVENFVPQDLRERLVANPKLATGLDFATSGCRIVVSLREDYLPKLERLRSLVPSLVFATSRMRLTEMNGEQALLAVSCPNPNLLTEKVAERIVRFVAGDMSEGQQTLVTLEVRPAILSLFCRELSIKRGEAPQITDELVTGNATTIIDDFYHRCVDDKPAALRRMIEHQLVTTWGYRDNIDLKQAKGELERSGVTASLVDDLINERLLHIEEHRGEPRIELTHDVLIPPVTRSREKRLRDEAVEREKEQEREALEKAREQERLARAEAERESRFRRLEMRFIAGTVAGVVLLACLVASVMLWRRAVDVQHKLDRALDTVRSERDRADDNSKLANENAEQAKRNEKLADDNAKLLAVQKERADNARQNAEKAFQQLGSVTKEFVDACDRNAELWVLLAKELHSRFPGESEIADDFSRVYEESASVCIDKARKVHDLDPNNAQITEYLGLVNLELADSALKRKDSGAATDQCVKAVETADSFQREPVEHYKTHLVAALTYAHAGYSFYEMNDSRASQTAATGLRVLEGVQRRRGTTQFDAWDWDTAAKVYFYRGAVPLEDGATTAASDFYERSFEAESNAIAKESRASYLEFAELLAKMEGDLQGDAAPAREWYDKARHVSDRRIAVLSSAATSGTDVEAGKELASAYSEAAHIDFKLGDWDRAIGNLQGEINIYVDLRKQVAEPSDQEELTASLVTANEELAIAYTRLAGAYFELKDWSRTISTGQKAVDTYENLKPSEREKLADAMATTHKMLANAYSELKDWNRAVTSGQNVVDIYENLRDKSTDDTSRLKLSKELAQAYGNLAWYELLAGRLEDARKHSEKGLRLDPKETWIRGNRAHALLLSGHVAEAEEVYLSLKDASYPDRNLIDDVKNDFQQLCEMNYARPEMATIAQRLGIDDAKLNSCLAAATVPK